MTALHVLTPALAAVGALALVGGALAWVLHR